MSYKPALDFFKKTFAEWSDDNIPRLSASVAFYAMLSIGPLLVISIKIVGMIFGKEAASGQIRAYTSQLVGPQGAQAVQDMVQNAAEPGAGIFATIFSVAVLLFSASAVFVELQDSMNVIWDVKPGPDRGWKDTIKERFLSMSLVLGMAFLLMVSLVVSTILAGLGKMFAGDPATWLMQTVNFIGSFAVITVLFALMFKYLPDVKVRWRTVWIGALATALMFTIGKFALGWYLARGSTTSIFGAAGSLVALLLWVYYSAQILFLGAEMTQIYAGLRAPAPAPAPAPAQKPASGSAR